MQELVVLVGHNSDFAGVYAPALEHAGYRVVVSRYADAVVPMLEGDPPDVVVAEAPAVLPTGRTVAEALHRDPRTARVHVVSVTARVMDVELQRERETGVTRVFAMPITPTALVDEIAALLGADT